MTAEIKAEEEALRQRWLNRAAAELAKVESARAACLWIEERITLPFTATSAVVETANERHQNMGKDIPYDDFVAPDPEHAERVKTIFRGIRVSRAPILVSLDHRRVTVCFAEWMVQPTKLPLFNLFLALQTYLDGVWPGAEIKVRVIHEVGRGNHKDIRTEASNFDRALDDLAWNDNAVIAIPPLFSKIAETWSVDRQTILRRPPLRRLAPPRSRRMRGLLPESERWELFANGRRQPPPPIHTVSLAEPGLAQWLEIVAFRLSRNGS